jgi:hypothetical protein
MASNRRAFGINGLANLTTDKAIIPFGGGIGADPFIDRAGTKASSNQLHFSAA